MCEKRPNQISFVSNPRLLVKYSFLISSSCFGELYGLALLLSVACRAGYGDGHGVHAASNCCLHCRPPLLLLILPLSFTSLFSLSHCLIWWTIAFSSDQAETRLMQGQCGVIRDPWYVDRAFVRFCSSQNSRIIFVQELGFWMRSIVFFVRAIFIYMQYQYSRLGFFYNFERIFGSAILVSSRYCAVRWFLNSASRKEIGWYRIDFCSQFENEAYSRLLWRRKYSTIIVRTSESHKIDALVSSYSISDSTVLLCKLSQGWRNQKIISSYWKTTAQEST